MVQQSVVKKYVKGLQLMSGESARMDCPFCGGSNTLSVNNTGSTLQWNCFRAACGTKGTDKLNLNGEQLSAVISSLDNTLPFESDTNDWEQMGMGMFGLVGIPSENWKNIPGLYTVPDEFVNISRSERALEHLITNNLKVANDNDLVQCKWDMRKNRFVYLIKHNGDIVDAVGRDLTFKSGSTKWHRYSSSNKLPFSCGLGSTAVLVEDATSASIIGSACDDLSNPTHNYTGIALLGTIFPHSYIKHMKNYKRIIVALDKDATQKSWAVYNLLNSLDTPIELVMLEYDLKYTHPSKMDDRIKELQVKASTHAKSV